MEYYLMHHGVKGQKWGVRRYQNEDGSLTDAGKKRYGVEHIHGLELDRKLLADDPSVKDSDIVRRAKYLKDTASKEDRKVARTLAPGERKAYYEARAVGLNKDASRYISMVGSKTGAGSSVTMAGLLGTLGSAVIIGSSNPVLAGALAVGGTVISPFLGYTVNALVDRSRNKSGKLSAYRSMLERMSQNEINMIDDE